MTESQGSHDTTDQLDSIFNREYNEIYKKLEGCNTHTIAACLITSLATCDKLGIGDASFILKMASMFQPKEFLVFVMKIKEPHASPESKKG